MQLSRSLLMTTFFMVCILSSANAALLGIGAQLGDPPDTLFNSTGTTTYDAGSGLFSVQATPLSTLFMVGDPRVDFDPNEPRSLTIDFFVDNAGAVTGGVPGDDLVMTGTVGSFSGVLLTGEIIDFGFLDLGTTDFYDARLQVTGGSMAGLFAGSDIGVSWSSDGSSFTGSFAVSFSGGAKGNLGPIPTQEACELEVDKTCIIPAPPPEDLACSELKPIDALTMKWDGAQTITRIDAYRDKFDPNDPTKNLIKSVDVNLLPFSGDTVTIDGYAAADAKNDVDWVLFSDGDRVGVSRFHRSCSDPDMDLETDDPAFPQDCGKLQGDAKDNGATQFNGVPVINDWRLEGLAGNGKAFVCTPPDPVAGADSCEVTLTPPPSCQTLKDNDQDLTSVTFQITAGGCDASSNDQGDKATCTPPGPSVLGPGPVTVQASNEKGDKPYLVNGLSSDTVALGEEITISRAGGDKLDSNSLVTLTGLGQEDNTIHTSCSQPLAPGDVFGSLTVVALNGERAGAEVIYNYEVTNVGDTDVFDIAVIDSPVPGSPFEVDGSPIASLAPNASVTLSETRVLDVTTTNTVTVTGATEGGAVCEAMDTVTVTVNEPPPPPVSCSDIKPITAVSLVWDGPNGVDVVTEGGEIFENVQSGNSITFSVVGLGNDVDLTLSGAVSGMSQVHVSCSDEEMNGSEDCGSNQGNGKNNDPSRINDWLLKGMEGENGAFGCPDVPSTGTVDPTTLSTSTGDVSGANSLDLGDDKKAKWLLSNNNLSETRTISEVTVSWPAQHVKLKKFKLDGDTFADGVNDTASPTTVPAEGAFAGDVKKRRIDPGKSRELVIEFDAAFKDHVQTDYSLMVAFEGGVELDYQLTALARIDPTLLHIAGKRAFCGHRGG